MPKLSRFFAASSDLLMVTRAQGAIVHRINPAFTRTLGWQEPERAATPFLDLVHEDELARAGAALSELDRGEQTVNAAFRMRTKGGGWRCIEWHATAFPEEGLHYWLGRDITDRPAVNGASAAAQSETAALRESMGDAYFAVDADWYITEVNRRATDLAQVTKGEVLGTYLWDILWQMKAAESPGYRYLNQAMTERRQIDFELYSQPLGFWASVSIYPREDGGLWVFVRDVSARKEAEEALRASEERLRLAQEFGGVGSFDWNAETDETKVSDQLRQIFGLPPHQPTTSQNFFGEIVHPDDVEALRSAAAAAIERGGIFKSEFRIIRPLDQQVRWLQVQAGLFRDGAGATRFVGIARDVTERRREQERERLLMGEIDHRGKNLLAVMRSVVQRTRAATTKQFIAAMTGRIESLARVHTLLAESGWEGVRLEPLVRDELAPFETTATRARFSGPAVELRPEAAQMMGLVLHELATNAAKHGALSIPEGRVAVEWTLDGATDELMLRWKERGGPAVQPPGERGFGTSVIQAGVAYQLGAAVEMDWQPQGLVVHLRLPAHHVALFSPACAEELGGSAARIGDVAPAQHRTAES